MIGKENSDWKEAEGGGVGGRRQIRKYQKKYFLEKKSLSKYGVDIERVKRGRKHVRRCFHESVVT